MAKTRPVVRGKNSNGNGSYRPDEHVSVEEVAGKIGCSRMTVLRLIDAGELTGCRLTNRGWWKVSQQSLKTYLAQLTAQERASKRRHK